MSETNNTIVAKENQPKKKRYNKPNNSYKVTNEYLFYKIADAGILFTYLHGVNKDKDGHKVFHFDRHPEIKEIIDREGSVIESER